MDFKLNVNGVFLLFVSNRCCALNFVPCEGRAFRSALNRFEQHQREELTVREALQPDLAQYPRVFARIRSASLQRERYCRGYEVDDEERSKEDDHSLEICRISGFRVEISLGEIPERTNREHHIDKWRDQRKDNLEHHNIWQGDPPEHTFSGKNLAMLVNRLQNAERPAESLAH